MNESYVVIGCKSWNRDVFDTILSSLPGTWYYIGVKEELTLAALTEIDPRYVFFLHWSWIVPEEIIERFTCINFHMTDLPYGRGGSPLQNLIERGHTETVLTAHRMTDELDAGPVYDKKPMSLEGTADEIFRRSSMLATEMIKDCIATKPNPVPQQGEVVVFQRRKPEQSRLPKIDNVEKIYDYIRMLDGEGYPPAYIEVDGWRYEFTNASRDGDSVHAEVTIRRSPEVS
ncbi:methionyl-tRNA formyltransferase [Candidatus Peribacteria bacterium]|nr:methionyl-tRNA formyltransferase [Candidatus Peribacteria bacterium]